MNRQIKADEGMLRRVPHSGVRNGDGYAGKCQARLTGNGGMNGTCLMPYLYLFYTHALAHGAQQRGHNNG